MSPFQRSLLIDSAKKVQTINVFRILLNVVIFDAFVVAVFLFAEVPFNFLIGSVIFVISIGYTVLKEFMILNRVKKMTKFQYDFLLEKHPQMSIYIPLISHEGKKNHLKSSALYLENDNLFLEAFKHQMLSTKPSDSITVPYGTEFIITSMEPMDLNGLIHYAGNLLEYDYEFYVLNEKTINDLMAKYIVNERNIDNANTSQ
ncbi:MAG: hypothetical protein PHC62_02210 [Candidatus Izemoplasmatales bacterium]|jgi:hypothetical protein|nr:hypothetical protein [Candidatus Izemoplasmatales bacterium]